MKNDTTPNAVVAIVVLNIAASSTSYIQVYYYTNYLSIGWIEDSCCIYEIR